MNKKIIKFPFLVIFCLIAGLFGGAVPVSAAGKLTTDCSAIAENPSCQFYYSDEKEFFIDGIKVMYGSQDVTSMSHIIFNTSPASTYDGSNLDYVVPFTAKYGGDSCEGQISVKIGLRGDANCDNKLDLNDVILIENELVQYYSSGKSTLTGLDGFGIFLANADGRRNAKNHIVYGKSDLNIGDAFFISSYLRGDKSVSLYESILQKNGSKPKNGEISISSAQGTAGDTVMVVISEKCEKTLGAFDFTCEWDDKELQLVSVVTTRTSLDVDYALKGNSVRIWGFGKTDLVKDGRMIALKFQIPESAVKGDKYNITVGSIKYFGAGGDIADYIEVNDGRITVGGTPSLFGKYSSSYVSDDSMKYDYGVKAWDAAVNYGAASAKIPVILLGGAEPQSLNMKVQCSAPLSVKKLSNAISVSGGSGYITGVYDSKDGLRLDFETLDVDISPDAKPGVYPIKITIDSISDMDKKKKCSIINGSVTIREKSYILGDANEDGSFNVRDAAYTAGLIAKGQGRQLTYLADYNNDNIINIRDAAAMAKKLSSST